MLTPEQIQKIADTMFPMLDALNARILRDMIKRLAARIGRGEGHMLTATDEWQAQAYQEAGGLLEDVQQEIQRFLQASDEEMARIFEDAAIKSLEADNRVYVQAGDKARSISPAMLRVLTDTYQRTKGTIHNFTRTTATETQKEFIRLLDEAHLRVMSGAGAYTQAVSDVMRELSETQTRVLYPSGHVDTIEVAVLRAIRTGTAQATGNMSLTDMEERGWDLIRVSAHIGARYGDGGENPGNHFWWQGKLYSKSGQDKRYPSFIATTGYGTGEGLCGWNCRHSFGPGDPNHNPYKDFDAEENKRVYDLSQKQREMEQRVRHTKTKLIGLREGIETTEDAGVKASLEAEYAKTAKLLERQNEAYNKFCEDNKLKRLAERIEVAKWTRADAKKSMMAAGENPATAKSLLQKPPKDDRIQLSASRQDFAVVVSREMGIREQTDYAVELANRFEAGTENARKAFIKYVRFDSVADDKYPDDPCFNPTTGKVYMNFANDAKNECGIGSTFFHEHGHLIDRFAFESSGRTAYSESLKWTSLQSSTFGDLLRNDFENLIKAKMNWGEYSRARARLLIAEDLYNNEPVLKHAVSDICGGLTHNSVAGPYSHDDEYWEEAPFALEREAFAHMFQAQFFPEQLQIMRRYFPQALAEFERLLSEVIK